MTSFLATQSSLLDPSGPSAVGAAGDWLIGLALGEIAVGLCVLAVAFVGFAMVTGQLALRSGLRVVLGCFVLLAAPTIAAGLMAGGREVSTTAGGVQADQSTDLGPREHLPPADYDPYAGASFRRE